MGSVEYQEVLSVQVGRFLAQKGLVPASSIGCAIYTLVDEPGVGILHEHAGAKPRKLLGLFPLKPKKWLLGTVWLRDAGGDRGANEKNWVFEVHGRENVETAKKLAAEMVLTFSVNIVVRLMSEEPLREYMGD
jgi:hypothetical protein